MDELSTYLLCQVNVADEYLDFIVLQEYIDMMKINIEENNLEKISESDNSFHEKLAAITQNTLFSQIANLVRILTSDIRLNTIKHMMKIKKSAKMVNVHQEILNAIKEKNASEIEAIIEKSYLYSEGVLGVNDK